MPGVHYHLRVCALISLGVPLSHPLQRQRLPRIDRIDNPAVAAAFGERFAQYSITEGQCSCDLYSRFMPEPDAGDSKRRRKYERMGWSSAKIERALAESARPRQHDDGLRADVAALIAGIAEAAGEVRLIVHTYRGSFAEERVRVGDHVTLSAKELRADGRHTIAEDTLYTITA